MLREQWVVTLALTPLTLLLFGQVSIVGLLANALAIPWVTLVITPLAMAGVALAPLWQLAAWAVRALEVYLHWLAALPVRHGVHARPAVVGRCGGCAWRFAAGDAAALAGAPAGLAAVGAGSSVAADASGRPRSSNCWRPTSGRATR